MKRAFCAPLFIAVLIASSMCWAAAPQIIKSIPANGAKDVPVDIGKIVIVFEVNMKMNSWSLVESGNNPFPPMIREDEPWEDPVTFVIRVKQLKPNTTYAIQLNSEKRKGFLSAEDQAPLPVTVITFTTGAESASTPAEQPSPGAVTALLKPEEPAQISRGPLTAPLPREQAAQPSQPPITVPLPKEEAAETALQPGIREGWSFSVTRMKGVKGTLRIQGQQDSPLREFLKAEFIEQVNKAEAGQALEVTREIIKAEVSALDDQNPRSGKLLTEEVAPQGQKLRVVFSGRESTVYDAATDQEIEDETVKNTFADPLALELWPSGELKKGQSWSYSHDELSQKLAFIEAQGGQMSLRVDRIEPDKGTGLLITSIRGQLKTKVPYRDLTLDYNAKVEIDLPAAIGVPFMIKIEGSLSGRQAVRNDRNQQVQVSFSGEGSVLQVCKPSKNVISSVRGAQPKAGPEQKPLPLQREDQKGAPDIQKEQSQPEQGEKSEPIQQNTRGTFIFDRVVEPREGAFSILVPKAWQVEGGIVRVDPAAQGGPAQSIEAKVDFAMKQDAAGTVMLHRLPDMLYIDTRGMPAAQMGMFQPGSNYQGMTVYPKMSAQQFLTQLVFPKVHPRAASVKIIEQKALPEFAQNFQRRSYAEKKLFVPSFQMMYSYDAALVTVEYDEGGIHYREKLLAVIEDWGQAGAGMWGNKETGFFRAPAAEYNQWEPIVSLIANSIKANPAWVAGEVKNQLVRAGIANATQKEIERISNEIVENKRKTNYEINNDMYLTLTNQEEYVNPFTSEVEVGSNQWKYRWVNPSGQEVYHNNDSYDPNHDLSINRSDFKRTTVRPR